MTTEYRIKRIYTGNPSPTNTAILPVCIGNDVHEGAKFEITLKWIVQKFSQVHVLVVDALQRHTIHFIEGVSPARAYDLSIKRGQEWVDRYSGLLRYYGLNDNLIYWGDLLKAVDYPAHYQMVAEASITCPALRDALEMDIDSFAERLSRRSSAFDSTQVRESCRNYILEELAAQHQVNVQTSGVEVYPNVELYSARAIRAGVIPAIPGNFVAVGFVRMSYRRLRKIPPEQEGVQCLGALT